MANETQFAEVHLYQEPFKAAFDYANVYEVSVNPKKPPTSWRYAPGRRGKERLRAYRVRKAAFQELWLEANGSLREDHAATTLFQAFMKLEPLNVAGHYELNLWMGQHETEGYYMRTQNVQIIPMTGGATITDALQEIGLGLEGAGYYDLTLGDLEWWVAYFTEPTQDAIQSAHDRLLHLQQWIHDLYRGMLKSGTRKLLANARDVKKHGWPKPED